MSQNECTDLQRHSRYALKHRWELWDPGRVCQCCISLVAGSDVDEQPSVLSSLYSSAFRNEPLQSLQLFELYPFLNFQVHCPNRNALSTLLRHQC